MKQRLRLCIVDPPRLLTVATQDEFYQQILNLIKTPVEVIMVNLEQVYCIDSLGLGILFGSFQAATRQGKQLVLCSPNQHVSLNLNRTGLVEVVTTYSTLIEAMQDMLPFPLQHSGSGKIKLPKLEKKCRE